MVCVHSNQCQNKITNKLTKVRWKSPPNEHLDKINAQSLKFRIFKRTVRNRPLLHDPIWGATASLGIMPPHRIAAALATRLNWFCCSWASYENESRPWGWRLGLSYTTQMERIVRQQSCTVIRNISFLFLVPWVLCSLAPLLYFFLLSLANDTLTLTNVIE